MSISPAPLVPALLVLAFAASAAALDPVHQSWRGVAIDGTDPVSYFEEGRPVKGVKQHAAEWKGATWYFASERNRQTFLADPERYAPRYGGYCAWAVSRGHTASSDPEAWKIVDGKLYLNYDLSVRKKWLTDVAGNIRRADENWPKLLEDD